MPLSIKKSSVMHCGKNADVSYSNHCQGIAAKASKTAGAIRHAFRSRDRNLLWAAFQSNVLPITKYYSPLRNPSLKKDINALENIQRRFKKCIHGLHKQSYADRLKSHIPTLVDGRFYADTLYIFYTIRLTAVWQISDLICCSLKPEEII